MSFRVKQKGDFKHLEALLYAEVNKDSRNYLPYFHEAGRLGVEALSQATPRQSGQTANSWRYEIDQSNIRKGILQIAWFNDNDTQAAPVAILLQYGHGTGTGGYVQGIDYINPALEPVFQKLADLAWEAATRK